MLHNLTFKRQVLSNALWNKCLRVIESTFRGSFSFGHRPQTGWIECEVSAVC